MGHGLEIYGQFFLRGQAKEILERISEAEGIVGSWGGFGSAIPEGIDILISRLKLGNSGLVNGQLVDISPPPLLIEKLLRLEA